MPQDPQSGAWEYFFPSIENIAGPTLNVAEEDALSKVQAKVFHEKPARVVHEDQVITPQKDLRVPEPEPEPEPKPEPEPEPVPVLEEMMETPPPKGTKIKQQMPSSMKHSVNLQQIFANLNDHFLKASESAHVVSKLLEATRLHYHSNFADNRVFKCLFLNYYLSNFLWVPIIMRNESEQAREWSQVFSEDTKKQSIPVIVAWQLNERMYGELQGLNKQETADKYGKEQVHEWRRSYDTPPPNGESLEMCAERAVAYFRDQIEPQLLSGKNIMIAAHGNSLRSIIMYLDKLTSQEVISLELSTGIPMLYIFKEGRFIRRGSPIGPTEAGVYAYTRRLALYRQRLDDMF
ncbi:uncharacterized protein LOC109792874 [Cajanus cajan]|uniref:uncharacterized protein LOC109792874 n=1 Tax=Cajanus cajan TaxID=3821 RepID=UPI00098D86A9|nr:uncharacterized protein LOC109792874 [Cajanus cajan]